MNQNVCRCCLLEQPKQSYNLFEHDLRSLLLDCLPNLHIERDDGLPEIICELCFRHLRSILQFRDKCQASELELKKRYDDTNKAIDEALRCTDISSNASLANLENFLLEDCSLSDLTDDAHAQTNVPFIDELLDDVLNNLNFDADFTNANCLNNMQNSMQDTQCISSSTTDKTVTKPEFACLQCSKKFTRNFQLKLHQNSVHNFGKGLPYQCSECKKVFASRSSLNYHYKSLHSSDRPFTCVYCSRRFVLRTQLASHLRVHTGEMKPRTHECQICGKFWPTKSDLRTHMRSHDPSVARPFKCDRCNKCFYSRGHLQSHALVHTGEKPFTCNYCQKSYQSIGNLNNHMVRHHADLMIS